MIRHHRSAAVLVAVREEDCLSAGLVVVADVAVIQHYSDVAVVVVAIVVASEAHCLHAAFVDAEHHHCGAAQRP